MSLRISNIRLSIDEPEAALPGRLARVLGLSADSPPRYRILRKALDARDHNALQFVYTVEATVTDEPAFLRQAARRNPRVQIDRYHEEPFTVPTPGTQPLSQRPVVVGSGPGGLVAAYFLAEQGYRPLVLERGKAVRDRIHDVRAFDAGGPHDPESNYLFGEGGAGTFSDGKLTYRGSGPDVRRVLELFAACKGKPSILYDARPHLGSNRLPAVVKAIRQRIEALGGEVRFSCRAEDLDLSEGVLRGVMTSSGYLSTPVAVLAIGHSARDTYEMLLRRGVPMEQKPFQMGVRIEQPQDTVNRVHYGETALEERLGAASYSLVANGQHDLFTFCMCAGGYIMPSVSEPGYFCTNGMSLSKHDSPYANSGLVVSIEPARFWRHGRAGRNTITTALRAAGLRGGAGRVCLPHSAGTRFPRRSSHDGGAGQQLSSRGGSGPYRGTRAALDRGGAAAWLADHGSTLAETIPGGGDPGRAGVARQRSRADSSR